MSRFCNLVVLLAAAPLFAADRPQLSVRSTSVDPPKDLSPAIRKLLPSKAIGVSDPAGVMCAIWMRTEVPIVSVKGKPTYRAIVPGTLVGAIRLERPWLDFRGNEAPAGIYTLRLALQPKSKDHEGTAPYRDFCILIPADDDPKPDVLPLKEMVKRSGKALGGLHPIVMLLVPNPEPPAEPTIMANGKRLALGLRASAKLGFAFTLIGSWTD